MASNKAHKEDHLYDRMRKIGALSWPGFGLPWINLANLGSHKMTIWPMTIEYFEVNNSPYSRNYTTLSKFSRRSNVAIRVEHDPKRHTALRCTIQPKEASSENVRFRK